MKRVIFITVILFSTSSLCAQKETFFHKHEVKASVGDALLGSFLWSSDDGINSAFLFGNIAFSYFYRPLKWLWIGGNSVNYFGENIHYTWREYTVDGSYSDFSKSKVKHCSIIAPEIRFSFLNKKQIILYAALSGGVGWENGFDTRHHDYPKAIYHFQITYFGFSCNFGKENAFFLGGELGIGTKSFSGFQGGYRF